MHTPACTRRSARPLGGAALVLSSVIALGLCGGASGAPFPAPPGPPLPGGSDRGHNGSDRGHNGPDRYEAHSERVTGGIWIKYQDLPRRVREVVDRERGSREIKQILEFRHGERVIFRVLVDERGSDRALLVSESGRVYKESEVPDLPVGRGSYERRVRVEDLPREVRSTLDRERGRFEVVRVDFVRRDNREFYRGIVDTRGDDLAIRINTGGKLLTIEETQDWAVGREAARYDWERERLVRVDDLPWAVRRTVDRERRGNPVKQAVFVERNGRRFYRVLVDDRQGDRILRVADDGYLYEEREVPDIAFGRDSVENNRYGWERRFRPDELPWAVSQTLDRERRGRPVKEVTYVRRYSHSFYRCVIDSRGDDIAIRIRGDGEIVSRELVEDVAIGREETEHAHGPREEWVKYATLPAPARRSLDRVRNDRPVLKIVRIDYRGRVVYKCTIDSPRWPTIVSINEDGQVVGW